jgi:predicted RNA-binding protein with PUA-like domain
MKYWLMKSEPDAFSIDDLKRLKRAPWDGVRNYQARNFMREMRKGDLAFFYHSSTQPTGIVGMMTIAREAYADPTQFDAKNEHYDSGSNLQAPRWDLVDVQFGEVFKKILTLEAIRAIPALADMVLVKRGRLSVQPVTPAQWKVILDRVHA